MSVRKLLAKKTTGIALLAERDEYNLTPFLLALQNDQFEIVEIIKEFFKVHFLFISSNWRAPFIEHQCTRWRSNVRRFFRSSSRTYQFFRPRFVHQEVRFESTAFFLTLFSRLWINGALFGFYSFLRRYYYPLSPKVEHNVGIDVTLVNKAHNSPLHHFCQVYKPHSLTNRKKFSDEECERPFHLLLQKGAHVNCRNLSSSIFSSHYLTRRRNTASYGSSQQS